MNLQATGILIAAGLTQATGSTILKAATAYRNGPGASTSVFWCIVLGAMLCFGAGFPLYAVALSRLKLSVAQPVFSATMFITVTLSAVLLFHEALKPLQAAGMAAIIGGILLVVMS